MTQDAGMRNVILSKDEITACKSGSSEQIVMLVRCRQYLVAPPLLLAQTRSPDRATSPVITRWRKWNATFSLTHVSSLIFTETSSGSKPVYQEQVIRFSREICINDIRRRQVICECPKCAHCVATLIHPYMFNLENYIHFKILMREEEGGMIISMFFLNI